MSRSEGSEKKPQSQSVVGDPLFDPLSWTASAGEGKEGQEEGRENGHGFDSNFKDIGLDGYDPQPDLETEQSDDWPWGHIFQPNVRGRTEVACTEDMNSDHLCSSGSDIEDPASVERLLGPRSAVSPARRSTSSGDLVQLIDRSSLSSPASGTEGEGVDGRGGGQGTGAGSGMRHCQSDSDILESLEFQQDCQHAGDSAGSNRRRSGDVISLKRFTNNSHNPPVRLVLEEATESFLPPQPSSMSSSYEFIPNLVDDTPFSSSLTCSDVHSNVRQSRTPSHSPKISKKRLSPRLAAKINSPSRLGKKSWLFGGLTKQDGGKGHSKSKLLDKSLSASKLQNITAMQNSIIGDHLRMNKNQYCDKKNFRFFVGTWNVNAKSPEDSLSPYLACYKPSNLEEKRGLLDDDSHWSKIQQPPHVFALGFQELDLSAEALLGKDLARETEWVESIRWALKEVGKYKFIHSIRLVGMLLVVFVEQSLAAAISDVDADDIPTGIMGIMGNKGGVAVRMKIHETTVCFVNSHLPAHMEEVERRNDDFKQIYLKLLPDHKGIDGHEAVFWMGDLNYRIQTTESVTLETIKNWANYYQLHELISRDQLSNQRWQKKVFEDFKEGELTFKPTYKYDSGTDNWDTSEKGRAPAWCDRVLWRSQHSRDVELLDYISHPKMMISDHKPVSALFDVKIMVPDKKRRAVVLEEAFRKADKSQNDTLPQVILETQEVHFGDVYYNEYAAVQVRVRNPGSLPLHFSFQKKTPMDEDSCAPWLTIRPREETIPGNDYCKLTFVADIRISTAEMIVKGVEKMEEIVVLHLDEGKDYFITVNGDYKMSFFGSSLHVLRYMATKGGIRGLPREELALLYKPDSIARTSGSGAPLELWKLCDHLFKFGLYSENLFIEQGLDREVKQIREFLDSGGALKDDPIPGSEHSVAEVFVAYLESLAEPIIPYNLHAKCIEAANNSQLCREILHMMPEIHRNCFVYILMFLKEILKYSSQNNSNPKYIASVFGNVLLRQDPSDPAVKRKKKKRNEIDKKKAGFILQFLQENII